MVLQATLIEPKRLQAIPVQILGEKAEIGGKLDGEGMVTALCALITKSGWRWAPVLF